MAYELLTVEKLKADILHAFRHLYLKDSMIVSCGANERCLAARFFAYVQNKTASDQTYKGLVFDPEYNRKGVEGEPKDMGGDGNIIPDLVLHKRGDDEANILVVEFKKSNNHGKKIKDITKLSYMTGAAYSYRFGLYVEIGERELLLSWFKGGSQVPILVERFDTRNWEQMSLMSENRQSARRRGCTLMITRRCNLKCKYCYEPYKTDSKRFDMSLPMAKRILKKEFEFVKNSSSFDEIEIDFMGGEPLMHFPLIKGVVEWLEKNPPPVPYICFATTNGTLVRKHIDWLRKHRSSFQMGGSCDGTPEMHEENRGQANSVEQMELLHDLYPNQNFHMTISRSTLADLAQGVLYLQKRGYRVECSLAQGENWTAKDALIYRRQLLKLAKEYLKPRCTMRPINLLTQPLIGVAEDVSSLQQSKFCGTGTHMATYDYDGKCYGCHLFTPLVLGPAAKTIAEIDYACAENASDARCKFCVLKRICPTCAGFNYRYRGAIGSRDMSVCKMVLAETCVASLFQAKKVARMKDPTTEDIECARIALDASEVLAVIKSVSGPYIKE